MHKNGDDLTVFHRFEMTTMASMGTTTDHVTQQLARQLLVSRKMSKVCLPGKRKFIPVPADL
jgi:hypothetical protein